MKSRTWILALVICLPVIAHAEMVAAKRIAASGNKPLLMGVNPPGGANPNCRLNENVSLTVNFTLQNFGDKAESARKFLIDRAVEMEAISKEVGITQFGITGMNYNFSGNMNANNGVPVPVSHLRANPADEITPATNNSFSGSISVRFLPAEKWQEFLVALSAKRYRANLNYNAYRENCNPNDTITAIDR